MPWASWVHRWTDGSITDHEPTSGGSGNDAHDRHEGAAGADRALRGCGWLPGPGGWVVAGGNDAHDMLAREGNGQAGAW
jgi:hypothetical protein